MARQLARRVIVDGVSYPAGSEPPPAVAARITNPKAWGEAPAPEPAVPSAAQPPTDQAPAAEEPPRAGAGSGRDAWAYFATSIGVQVTDDMGRDDIVEAVDAQK